MQERRRAAAAAALRKWDHQELNPTTAVTTTQVRLPLTVRVPLASSSIEIDDSASQQVVCWPVLVGAFIIQFVVPSVLTSQGVYVSHLLLSEKRLSYSGALLPPAVFCATWSLAGPWCRRVGLRHRGADGRLLAGCGVLLLAMSLAASSLSVYSPVRIITFGIIGGLGCSLAVSQCEVQLALHSPPHNSLALSVSHVAQALGHFIFPLVLVGLLAGFGAAGAALLQCAFVLHGLAGALLFRTAPRFFIDTAMSMQLSTYSSLLPEEGAAAEGSGRSWHNPSTQDTSCGEEEDDGEEGEEEERRRRNHMGVEIMPQIPEEDETEEEEAEREEEEGDTNKADSNVQAENHWQVPEQRDSWCPVAPLGIYLPAPEDSTVKGDSPKPLLTPSSLTGATRQVFDFKRPVCCLSCGPGLWGCLQKAWKAVCKCAKGLCRPMLVPGLLVSSAVRLVPLGVATLTPALAQHLLHMPRAEAAFAVAVAGFGWLCLGVCTPCMLAPAARKHVSLVYALASCASAAGLFMLSRPVSADQLTLGCAVVGMAHGVLVLAAPLMLRQLGGSINHSSSPVKAQDALDQGVAIVVIAATLLSYLLAESAESYCAILLVLAAMQACLGAASLAWVVAQRVRMLFCLDKQRSRCVSETTTDWAVGVMDSS